MFEQEGLVASTYNLTVCAVCCWCCVLLLNVNFAESEDSQMETQPEELDKYGKRGPSGGTDVSPPKRPHTAFDIEAAFLPGFLP